MTWFLKSIEFSIKARFFQIEFQYIREWICHERDWTYERASRNRSYQSWKQKTASSNSVRTFCFIFFFNWSIFFFFTTINSIAKKRYDVDWTNSKLALWLKSSIRSSTFSWTKMSFLIILNSITIVVKNVDDIKNALNLLFEIWRNQFHCSFKTFNMTKKLSMIFQKLLIDSYNSKRLKFYHTILWQSSHVIIASSKKLKYIFRCLSAKWQIDQIKFFYNINDLDVKLTRIFLSSSSFFKIMQIKREKNFEIVQIKCKKIDSFWKRVFYAFQLFDSLTKI